MKNLFFSAIVVLCGSMFFASCDSSEFDKEFEAYAKNKPNETPNDNNNGHDGDWGTVTRFSFGTSKDNWSSTITLDRGNNDSITFKVNLPFTCTLGDTEYTTTNSAAPSEFVRFGTADTQYSEWTSDGQGNYLRTVTRTQEVIFSKFTRTLVSTHMEAYRIINGQEVAYKTASEGNVLVEDVVRNLSEYVQDSIKFERESNEIIVSMVFNKEYFETSATTHVDREVEKISDNEETTQPETPKADMFVSGLVKVTPFTFSPQYNAKGDKIAAWHVVSLVETESQYHVFVDNSFVQTWEKEDLYPSDSYNSAIYVKGRWTPAIITMNSDGWIYATEYSDGGVDYVDMAEQNAVNGGIRSLMENSNAKPTPFITSNIDKKEVNGKKYISVSGVTTKGVHAYTVAEK